MFPGSVWVPAIVLFSRVLFLFTHALLFITVLVATLYYDCVWCVFLYQFYLLNRVILIITILIITQTVLMFIIRLLIDMGLRC